ncbi:SsgA family sporulation/cell division regulator [Kitasatospora albolonga]|uniref:SsgA family sporulation/cell division regulator n=1 Tax=Kitasatospora albolonga TaxID=68173 RepID=UPI0031E7E203
MSSQPGRRLLGRRRGRGRCARPTVLTLVAPSGEPVTLAAQLCYLAADPYAVHLDCEAAPGAAVVRWTFARELLVTGLRERAGIGDVRIFPPGVGDPEHLVMVLCGVESSALLLAPVADVEDFLAAAERLVPTGSEHRHLGVDRLPSDLRRPPGARP